MKDHYLSIGKMASINHITIPTLRLYDDLGLLKPIYIDPESNYRYYDIRQNSRLDLITYMKELGMNLKEIKELLDKEDLTLVEAILIQKREQVEEQIKELEMKKDAITRNINSLERHRKSPKVGMITLEYIDQRRIYSMHTAINFYDYDLSMYENILKDLKNTLYQKQLPRIYYTNAGTIMPKKNFIQQNYDSHEIFIFVDRHFPLKDEIKVIENGMYACIYLDDFDKEKEFASRLLDYCNENHYKIEGDYICEVLTEFDLFDANKRSMFLRLQVPISF